MDDGTITFAVGINRLLCRGIDGQQTLLQGIYLHLTHGLGGGHQLAVDIGDTHTVGIDNRHLPDAATYQTLSAPRAYATHAKEKQMAILFLSSKILSLDH